MVEPANDHINSDNPTCGAGSLQFIKQRLISIVAHSAKRFAWYKALGRTLLKDVEDDYLQDNLSFELMNLEKLMTNPAVKSVFATCTPEVIQAGKDKAATLTNWMSFMQKTEKSGMISKEDKKIKLEPRFVQTASKSKLRKAEGDAEEPVAEEGASENNTADGKKAMAAANKVKRLPKAIMPLDFQCQDKEIDMFVCFLNWLSNNYIPKDFDEE